MALWSVHWTLGPEVWVQDPGSNSASLFLHSGVLMGTGKLSGKPVEILGGPLQWSSITSWGGGEVVILTSCYLEIVKASGWINPLTPTI